jgi:hypothetical protein
LHIWHELSEESSKIVPLGAPLLANKTKAILIVQGNGCVWLSLHATLLEVIHKDICGLAQAKGLPSLIYHEPALEVRFVRGVAGPTSFLTKRDEVRKKYSHFGIYQ